MLFLKPALRLYTVLVLMQINWNIITVDYYDYCRLLFNWATYPQLLQVMLQPNTKRFGGIVDAAIFTIGLLTLRLLWSDTDVRCVWLVLALILFCVEPDSEIQLDFENWNLVHPYLCSPVCCSASMPSIPGVCGKFYRFCMPGTLQMTQSGASRAACQSLKRLSRSGWGFSGTWLDQLQRRTITVSPLPHCDHHLIGGDPLVVQDPPGWEW